MPVNCLGWLFIYINNLLGVSCQEDTWALHNPLMLTLMIHIQHMGTTIPILLPSPPVSPLPICAEGQMKWSRINNGKARDRAIYESEHSSCGIWWASSGKALCRCGLRLRPTFPGLKGWHVSITGRWIFCSKTFDMVNLNFSSVPWNVKYRESHLWMSLSFRLLQQASNLFQFMKLLGSLSDALVLSHENLTSIMSLL